MFDIYGTYYMLTTLREMPPQRTFFHSRYFPTNRQTDIFKTNKVLCEYKEGKTKLAPFVVPRVGGVPILREGYETWEFEPPNIAPSRPLTIDELEKKDFGEALYSQLTPEDRERRLLLGDLDDLSAMVTNREEWMAINTILNNGCVMNHISDKADKFETREVRFYTGDANPAVYVPAKKWNAVDGKWMSDVAAMAFELSNRGLPVTDLVVSADVGDFILSDEKVQKLLDNRNYNIGAIEPELLPDGTVYIGKLNFSGVMLGIYVNRETYEDDGGVTQKHMPNGTAFVTAPACGRTLYGAVTQMEEKDSRFHTYAAMRVPKHNADSKHNIRETIVTAKPLCMPNRKNPWIVAKNVLQ